MCVYIITYYNVGLLSYDTCYYTILYMCIK